MGQFQYFESSEIEMISGLGLWHWSEIWILTFGVGLGG